MRSQKISVDVCDNRRPICDNLTRSFVIFGASRWSRFGKKFVDFVFVGFEGVAHDEEVAAIVRDRVPVDDVGLLSILEVSDGAGAPGCARVGGPNARRA